MSFGAQVKTKIWWSKVIGYDFENGKKYNNRSNGYRGKRVCLI